MLTLNQDRDSWAGRLPVGAKMAALCVASIWVFQVQSLGVLGAVLAIVIGLYASLGWAAFAGLAGYVKPLFWILAILLAYHLVTGALVEGMRVALKMVSLVLLANFVTLSSALDDLISFVMWLIAPLKRLGVNTYAIALAIAMVIRFVPVMVQKGGLLAQSWQARSRRRAGWRIVLPMLILALDDADQTALALRARGGVSSDNPEHR